MNAATGAEAYVVLRSAIENPANPQSLWDMGGDGFNGKAYPTTDDRIGDDFGSAGGYGNSGVHWSGYLAQPFDQFHIYSVSSQPNDWLAWMNGVLSVQTANNTVSFASTPFLGVSYYQDFTSTWIIASSYLREMLPKLWYLTGR